MSVRRRPRVLGAAELTFFPVVRIFTIVFLAIGFAFGWWLMGHIHIY